MKKGGVVCLRLRYFEDGKERKKFNQFETLSEEDRQKAVDKLNAMAVEYNREKERQGSGFEALTEDERKAITRFREYRMECFRAGITCNTLDELMGFAINRNNSLNDSPLFENALDDYLHFQDKQGHSAKHLKEITYRLRKMEKHFSGNKVGNITTEMVSKYLMNMTTQSGKLTSVDSVLDYRSTLGAFFQWLLKRDIISKNPVAASHRPKRKPKAPEIFTVEQTQNILQTALEYHSKAIPALVLGFFCGVRTEEIARLTKDRIDLVKKEVAIRTESKTNMGRFIPLPDNAIKWLKAVNFTPESGTFILEGDNDERRIGSLRRLIRRITTQNGLKWVHNGMRHSFATYACAIHDMREVDKWLGHTSDLQVLMTNYRNLVPKQEGVHYFSIIASSVTIK